MFSVLFTRVTLRGGREIPRVVLVICLVVIGIGMALFFGHDQVIADVVSAVLVVAGIIGLAVGSRRPTPD